MSDILGYKGLNENAGIFIDADDALDFALERCGLAVANQDAPELENALAALEEWFYSGDWKTGDQKDE